jgi:RNA polymerase-binding protein DksA
MPGAQAPPPAPVAKPGATVLPGERPWQKPELAKVQAELEAQVKELRGEITEAEESWAALQRDSGEGAGDDQADAGTKTFEREHELSLAANSRDLLSQVERALQRLEDGTYPICESCGNPIGKARLQAFPRATLCVTCKQREERR